MKRKNPGTLKPTIEGDVCYFTMLARMAPDTVQYKPYGIGLVSPEKSEVYVRCCCPSKEVLSLEPFVLTPTGMALAAKEVATRINAVFNTR